MAMRHWLTIALLSLLTLTAVSTVAQSPPPGGNVFCAANLNCAVTGTWTFSTDPAFTNINAVNGNFSGNVAVGATVQVQSGSLAAAEAALPSGGTLVVSGVLTVPSTHSTPANIKVRVDRGGGFNISSGQVLTFVGPFEAGLYQVFFGSGSAAFAQGAVTGVYAGWWYSGSGAWDSALASAVAACQGAVAWCNLPPAVSTTGTLVISADNTMLRSLSQSDGNGQEATYGTGWTHTATAAGVDIIATSGYRHNLRIHGIGFVSGSSTYPSNSALNLGGAGSTYGVNGCWLDHVGAVGPFATAAIINSGLQNCKQDNLNITSSSTTVATPVGIRFLGPGSTPPGLLSTTTDIVKPVVSGVLGATGGITSGIVFDGDACLGCNVYSMTIQSVAQNAVNVGKGNTVDFHSPYTENVPNSDVAYGLFRIGQDYPSATYNTYVNLYGGEVEGTNSPATYVNSTIFDLGKYFFRVNIHGTQFNRAGTFQSNTGDCATCIMTIAGVSSNVNAGFGAVTYPGNFVVGQGSRFNSATLSTGYPALDAHQGPLALAPSFYQTAGATYLSTDYGPAFYRVQACSGVTVNITAASGPITAATIASGGSGCAVNDVLPVVQTGGANATLLVTTQTGGVVSAVSVLSAGTGYATASGLSTTAIAGVWENAQGGTVFGTTPLTNPIATGSLTINESTGTDGLFVAGPASYTAIQLHCYVTSTGGRVICASLGAPLYLQSNVATNIGSTGTVPLGLNYDPYNGSSFGDTVGVVFGDGANHQVAKIDGSGSLFLSMDPASTAHYIKLIAASTPGAAYTKTLQLTSGTLAETSQLPLSGTTASIGGSLLAVGCTSQSTVTVTGATTAMACVMSGVGGNPANIQPQCSVTAANTVTPQLCTAVAVTPAAQTYNLRVIQ